MLCFFPVQESTAEQARSSFGGVHKYSGERVLWYVFFFLPPYVLHKPISRPIGRNGEIGTNRTIGVTPFCRPQSGGPSNYAKQCQARKKEHKPKLSSPDISGWVGVFHVKGWGPKSSVCPSEPGKSNFFGGTPRNFAGISRLRPKSLTKRVSVQFLAPEQSTWLATSLAFYRSRKGPLPRKLRKKSGKGFPGPLGPGVEKAQKSRKKAENGPKTQKKT